MHPCEQETSRQIAPGIDAPGGRLVKGDHAAGQIKGDHRRNSTLHGPAAAPPGKARNQARGHCRTEHWPGLPGTRQA